MVLFTWFSVELCSSGQINKVVLSRFSALAGGETGCDCSGKGSTGGAAQAEKSGDHSRPEPEHGVAVVVGKGSRCSEQVDFMPQCSGSNCTQTRFIAS